MGYGRRRGWESSGLAGWDILVIQFAKAFGAEVTAFSTSKDKEAEAKKLGAHHFVNTRETGALKKVAGSFDLLLSTVSADQDWQCVCGRSAAQGDDVHRWGPLRRRCRLPVFSLILRTEDGFGQCDTGSPRDLFEMLDVAARHDVKAITERFAMAKANDAVAKVKKSQVRYRAVLAN